MGNQPSDLNSASSNKRARSIRRLKSFKANASNKSSTSKASRVQRKQCKALKKTQAEHEAFFIALHKSQSDLKSLANVDMDGRESYPSLTLSAVSPPSDNAEQLDLSKRVVFVSLMGLYHSWRQCPSMILYSAVFLLPLKREWVYTPDKFSFMHDFGNMLQDPIFVKLLKWKDTQGLLFCMKDAVLQRDLVAAGQEVEGKQVDERPGHLEVAPFWRYLSAKLCTLYDPVTRRKYRPLILDNAWWQTQYKLEDSQFMATPHQIFLELHLLSMKFRSISEILYQSNPSSFHLVTKYGAHTVSADNSVDCGVISPSDAPHKSYTVLPDRKLLEIAKLNEERQQMAADHDDGEVEVEHTAITEPDEHVDDVVVDEETDNIWWISTEYDEVIENHDNDALYDDVEDDEAAHYAQPEEEVVEQAQSEQTLQEVAEECHDDDEEPELSETERAQ